MNDHDPLRAAVARLLTASYRCNAVDFANALADCEPAQFADVVVLPGDVARALVAAFDVSAPPHADVRCRDLGRAAWALGVVREAVGDA